MKLALTLLLACTGPLAAFTPVLDRLDPRGAQRGTTVDVKFYGDRLEGPIDALIYDPGITLSSFTVKDPKNATASLTVAADAPLGEHSIRLLTPSGVTEVISFWVGQFPTVPETEPNSTFEQAQRIPLNTTVAGVAGNEDDDYFVCTLKKGQRLSVEIEAMRLGRTLFDSFIAILDARKFELVTCDDSPLLRTDSFASIIAPEDGDYRILVHEAAYEGNDACQYRLHIGTFPRPTAVFPPGGKPGESIEFTFTGDPAGPIRQTITLPAQPSSRFPIFPVHDGQFAPSPHYVTVSPLAYASEAASGPTPLPAVPCAAHGIIDGDPAGDTFSFQAKKGENLVFRVIARSLRSPLDSVLSIRNPEGATLSANDDQGSPDSVINWAAPADGTFHLHIRDQLHRHGPDFTYRIEITPKTPALSATLPTVERVKTQKWKTFPVPRGNRYAALINLSRENTSCDATFTAEGLPPGTTLHCPPITKAMTAFPIVLQATPDAPPAGALSSFTLRATDNPRLSTLLTDTINYIEVNNEGTYQSVTLDRIATAVTAEAPFHIDLEPPQVPLVRNGTAPLKFHLTRSPGYTGKVIVRMLWSPPGITGPATVDIPGDQVDAIFEANASSDAAIADWQICLLAEGETPQGPVLVSSALTPLKVAEPWLSLTLDLAATTRGQATAMTGKLESLQPFEGNASATLLGLPHGASCPPQSVPPGATEISFPIAIAPDAAVGKHGGIFCRIEVPWQGKSITHLCALNSTLRIDSPPTATPGTPTPPPTTAGQPAPASKPLSRLEQLRQQSKPR